MFVISLDFELFWGVLDSRGEEYFPQLIKVQEIIPDTLSLFKKYDVSATWAVVGAVLCENFEEFNRNIPSDRPSYDREVFSPYYILDKLSTLDTDLLFTPNLIKIILSTPKQELASHTFCHYYCLESGQSLDEFSSDLKASSNIAKKYNCDFKSLVFPRNQFNSKYLAACSQEGITSYRGNPKHWAYNAENREEKNLFKRAFRLVDSYIPLSGSLRQNVKRDRISNLVDIPASLFLRPWSSNFSFLEPFRLWRIKWSMTRAAKKGGMFHLWWHPHNFGVNTYQNLAFLEQILKHYQKLNIKYGFESLTMNEVASRTK